MKTIQGFTLIELMIAVILVAVLVVLGVPSFLVSLTNSNLNAESNRFLGALVLARGEAIKRGVSVTVCPTVNQEDCVPTTDWSRGWMVFVDNNGNGIRDGNDEILRRDDALRVNLALLVNNENLQFIRYLPSGNARGVSGAIPNSTFLLCRINRPSYLNDEEIYARSMSINFIGRTAIIRGQSGAGHRCPA